METIDIKAEARSQVGKGSARAARRAGLVPAVIYGNKQSAIPITLDANKWRQLMNKPGIFSQLMNIDVNNEKHFVLPRDIQQHPVSEEAEHVDFYDQMVRGVVAMPNGTGKTMRVAVFAKDAKADEAKAAGADLVGAEDLAEAIQNG